MQSTYRKYPELMTPYMEDFLFDEPLVEGVILDRKSMYTMTVRIGEESMICHCPTTGRIGNLDVSGLPCLLSKASDPKRKTPYTVEAVSLNRVSDTEKEWIGINQNMANRFVEHYLRNGGFREIVGTPDDVRREVFLGDSKLDFQMDSVYLEVKTPLQTLQVEVPEHVKTRKVAPFSSTDRMCRHMQELADSLKTNEKAVLLIVFIYDNPGFRIINRSTNWREVSATVRDCVRRGVETWQVNFRLTPVGVSLSEYYRIQVDVPDSE